MKKFILRFIFIALLLTITFLTATSCSKENQLEKLSENERAFALMQLTDKAMDSLDSYTEEAILNLNFSVEEQNFKLVASSKGYLTDVQNNPEETVNTSVNLYIDGTLSVSSSYLYGYSDGVMFLSSSEAGHSSNLKSETPKEKYIKHRERENEYMPDIVKFLKGCKNSSAGKEKDGSWTATFSNPDEETMVIFSEFFEDITSSIGNDFSLVNITATVSTTKLFYIKSIETRLIYQTNNLNNQDSDSKLLSSNNTNPTLVITEFFSNYNTTKQPSNINFENYTEVPDLTDLYAVAETFSEIGKEDERKFDFYSTHKININTYSQISKRKHSGTYKNYNENFSYKFISEADGSKYSFKYQDGIQSVAQIINEIPGDAVTAKSNDYAQRVFLKSNIFDQAGFSIFNVQSFTTFSNGENQVYNIKSIQPNQKLVNSIVSSLNGISIEDLGSEIITLEFDPDGNLINYKYKLTIRVNCPIQSHIYTAVYTINSECSFSK